MEKQATKMFSKEWIQKNALSLAAYGGLLLCLIIFTVLPPMITNVSIWSPGPLKSIVKHIAVYALMAMGATFVYSLGYMDISIGAQLSMYALLIMLSNSWVGNIWLGVALCLVISAICGLINGAVAVFLKMPSIVTSLFLQFIIYGINILIIQQLGGGQYITMSISGTWMEMFREPVVLIVIMAVSALVMTYLFNFTRIGKNAKAIGANEDFVRQSGVNTTLYKVIMYLIVGVCVVLAAIVYVGLNGTADSKAGSGMEMQVMLCLIMGGMPLAGGMKSRISSALIGAVTYTLVTDGLKYLQIDVRLVNLFVAFIFVVVVFLTCRKSGKVLPR